MKKVLVVLLTILALAVPASAVTVKTTKVLLGTGKVYAKWSFNRVVRSSYELDVKAFNPSDVSFSLDVNVPTVIGRMHLVCKDFVGELRAKDEGITVEGTLKEFHGRLRFDVYGAELGNAVDLVAELPASYVYTCNMLGVSSTVQELGKCRYRFLAYAEGGGEFAKVRTWMASKDGSNMTVTDNVCPFEVGIAEVGSLNGSVGSAISASPKVMDMLNVKNLVSVDAGTVHVWCSDTECGHSVNSNGGLIEAYLTAYLAGAEI